MQPLSLLTSERVVKKLSWTGLAQFDTYANLSFSQMGEDRVLSVLFNEKKNGFYVDVGAHHPKLYSNTYLFYLRGWRGINIDPMPHGMNLFRQIRPRDINLEIAIGKKKQMRKYFMFSNSAVNTFSQKHMEKLQKKGEHKLIRSRMINSVPLHSILSKYLKKDQVIDFLSIDVEGKELEVLQSIDFNDYKPRVVLAEDLDFSFLKPSSSAVNVFLLKIGYKLYAKTAETLIFVEKNFSK